KFIILLHQVLYDYVTLFDVYECAINPKLLEKKIEEGVARFVGAYVAIEIEAFERHPALDPFSFVIDHKALCMRAPISPNLIRYLKEQRIDYRLETTNGQAVQTADAISDEHKCQQFEAVKRWFYNDWARIEPKLRTSIIEGISVFLSLFD